MGFKDWKNTQAAGVVSEAQPPQPADGGRTSFRQWKKLSAKQSAVSPTVQPAAAQDTGKQSAVASIKSAVQSRTQALRLDPAQAEQDLLEYSARLRELEQQPMGVSDGAVEYLEGAKTRYEAIGRALEDMLPQAQADPAQYAEQYNALLRQYEEAGRNYTVSAQRYNRQVGAAQQNIDAYNETLRRYRETQAALDNYTRLHKNEPAKLEAQAKALSLEADWLDKRAREIEKDVIGYENMHPETGRSASTLYRDMSPEQVGEYMQEHVWGPLQEAGAMRDPAKAEAMRTRAAQLTEQAQAAQARVDSMEYREQMRSYLPLMQSADWAEKSKADPAKLEGKAPQVVATQDESGVWHQTVISTGFDDLEYAIINGAEGARGMDDAVAADSAGVLSRAYLTQMTDEEQRIYNYLYSTKGKKAAQEFLEQIKPRLEKAQRAEDQAWWRAQAQKKPWAMSAFTVLTSPLSVISLFGQASDLATRGSIDKDAAYNRFTYIPSAIRDEVAQQVKKAWGPEAGNLGSFLYQTGMSMADFLFQSAVTGGFAGGAEEAAGSALARTVEKFTRPTLLVMGTNAAASTVQKLMDEGMDSTRAFILGVVAGFAEILTENVSLETLLNPDKLADGVINYIMKNMLAEASEEAASDVLNWSADALYDLISGQDQSEWKMSVRELETGGMSRADAVNHLLTQRITELGLDALGGALSGGVMAAGGAAVDYAALYARTEGSTVKNVVSDAQLASAITKIENGQELTLNDARKIINSPQALEFLRETGALQKSVKNDSEGRHSVLEAVQRYAEAAGIRQTEAGREAEGEARQTAAETQQDAAEAQREVSDNMLETAERTEMPQPENLLETAQDTAVRRQEENLLQQTPWGKESQALGDAAAAKETTNDKGVQADEQTDRSAAERRTDTAGSDAGGADVSGGGRGRVSAQRAGVQAGRNAGREWQALSQPQKAAGRNARAKNLRLQTVEASSLGIKSATADSRVTEYPETEWEPDLRRIADRVKKATGMPVRYVLGTMRVDAGGKELPVRGVNTGREIFVQADAMGVSAEKIATHEAYHAFARQDPELNRRMLGRIKQQYPGDNLRKLAELYLEKTQGIADVNAADPADLERAMAYIQEEVCADAYAGINAFRSGVDKYTETARAAVNESRQNRQTAEATEQRTGPPEERGSAADEDAEYMAAVEAGDMETAQRMVDEAAQAAGYTVKAYHGTPNGTYNVFRDWSYFTENKDYADSYQNQGASSNGYKQTADKPKTYSVYLDPRNVFDTRTPRDREIFQNEFYQKWGNGAPLSERGLPDWTDGDDLIEFFDENGYNYDAFYLDEGGTGGYGDEVEDRGISIIVKDSAQVKSADPVTYDDQGNVIPLSERFNPENQDIRYSAADEEEYIPESAAEYGQLRRQGKIKPEKVKKPVAKSQATRAKADLRSSLLGAFSIPTGSRAELGAMIDAVADKVIREGKITEQEYRRLYDTLYAEGRQLLEAEDYLQDIRQLMAKGRIFVPEKVRHEWGDDWSAMRKKAWANGIYLTSSEEDAGIDQWWQTLSDTYAGLFPADEYDPRTMLERMVQLAEEGKGELLSLEEYAAELEKLGYVSADEAADNLDRQLDWALRTFAEKAKLELDLRDRTGIKIAQERQRGAELREQAVQRERARGDRRVQAEREHGRELLSNEKAREALRRRKERERRQEVAKRQRERQAIRELQQKTLKQLQWMNRNQGKFPQEMQARVKELLEDMDILAVGAADEMHIDRATGKTWKDLRDIYLEAKEKDPNWLPSRELDNIVMRLDARKIEDLDMGALQDLYKAALGLRTELYNRNNLIEDELHRTMQEVYDTSKSEIQKAPGGYKPGAGQQYWDNWQLTPLNRMEMMAGWNPNSAWFSMARGLEAGERAQRRFKERSAAYLDEFFRGNAQWAARADGQGKDAIWYELEVPELLEYHMGDKPIFGNTVKVYMTPAQKVELYLESKGYDNLRHMTGGRTFADRELYSQGKRREAYAQGKTIRLAPESVKQIVSDLTPEEQELARILEDYYNHYSKQEINRVSNALYGYDKAMESYYAPIYTNGNYNKSEPGIFDLTAEGVGNLKGRIRGVNPTLNISAFDAFEKSVDRTSRFVGMAIPIRNMNSLMNWRDQSTSMKDVLSHKWGDTGEKFVEDLMTELQNGKEGSQDPMEGLVNTILSRYISSVFGFNPSIVLKQFASYPLAATYLGWENMPKWVPGAAQVDTDLISKYSAELAYRLRGYATPETATVKDNPGVFQRKGPLNFLLGGGAITWMDGFTVRTLWTWAENKVSREQPDLELGTEEQVQNGESPFYKAVAKEFEEAVSRSQPMYDTMHRSEIMRKGGLATRTLTLFKTVPQQELNMLRQTMGEAAYYKRIGADKQTQAEARRKAGRALTGILTGNLMIGVITFLNALVKNGAKAFRNDDGELTPESVMEQIGKQYFKDAAGLTVGGDVAADILAARLFGDKWYGLETPGIEQIEGLIDKLGKTADTMGKLVTDSINLANNGGDWGRYMAENGNTYVKAVEEAGRLIGTYATGLPLDNVKAYLLGAASGISPAIKTAYEDLMSKADKSGLKGLSGAPLEMRVQHILDDRAGGAEEQTTETIAALYAAGYTGAVPAAVTDSYTVGGESRSMSATDKLIYTGTWRGTVEGTLDALTRSKAFRSNEEADQEKMLKWLYDVAAQRAKASVWPDYTPEKAVQTAEELERMGVPLADWLPIRMQLTSYSGKEKKEQIVAYINSLPYTADVKDAMYLASGYTESTLDDTPWHKRGGGSGGQKERAPANLNLLRTAPESRSVPTMQLPTAQLPTVQLPQSTSPTLQLPTNEGQTRQPIPTMQLPTA